MNSEDIKLALDIAWKAGVVLIAIYTWWSNRDKATKSAIDRIERRLQRVEDDMRHQPTRADMNQLAERIGTLHADLQAMAGSFQGVQRAVDLMHQHLLDRSGK